MAAASTFTTENIRNVVVLGHGGSGKTTLIDAICFAAGTSRRKGSVPDGTALTMTSPEEKAHGMSLELTVAHAVRDGTKINFLDTPGYMDFMGEAAAAARVADAALVTVGATGGVEVGTELMWELCEKRSLPRIIVVSMMDKAHANFGEAMDEIHEKLSPSAVPVQLPIGAAESFRGVVDLFSGRARVFKPGSLVGESDEQAVPADMEDEVEEASLILVEAVAETDEDLLERYLDDEEISADEMRAALARAVARGEVIPVYCAATEASFGGREVARGIVDLAPHPGIAETADATDAAGDATTVRTASDEPTTALVFKTATEPHVGELSIFRVYSGTVANGVDLHNTTRGAVERINHLAIPQARERVEVAMLHAGDIGVLAKLKSTGTNDTLAGAGAGLRLEGVDFPSPDISVAVRGVARSDEDKLGEALGRLHDEDPTFEAGFNPELRQTIARGMGELHFRVHFERMKRKYGVSVEAERPRIAYRETITAEAEGQGRFKKQTGGRGQFGDCWVRLRPRERGEGYEFVNSIKGGVIPTKYVPSVDRGIREAAEKGVVAGYPLVDFEAECYDGSYHSVDSSDIAFKVAGSYAFRNVAEKSKPVLLEPIIEVRVTAPDEYVGDIMGNLNGRSARVLGMDPQGGVTVIRAIVAEAELHGYASSLRSITQGRGHHRRKMLGYDVVPAVRAAKIVAEAQEEDG